jgi:hypothetical protein
VNQDGFGNICDADVTNDGIVGLPDFLVFGPCFGMMVGPGATCTESDFTGDGVVGIPDYLILGMSYGHPPGPSGLWCAGSIPCP